MRKLDDYSRTTLTKDDLWQAAKANDLESIKGLVNHGADINERDQRGYSPLMFAVYCGHNEASEALIELGADVNSCDLSGNSILMSAAFKGNLELVRKLVEAGAQLDLRNHSGIAALDFAVTFGRTEVINYLSVQGNDVKPHCRVLDLAKTLYSRLIG